MGGVLRLLQGDDAIEYDVELNASTPFTYSLPLSFLREREGVVAPRCPRRVSRA
jgi:hypothetical protein